MNDNDINRSQRPTNVARLEVHRSRGPTHDKAAIDFDNGFHVGAFEAYPKRLALIRDGVAMRLEPKVMAVLMHLARRGDQVVTRDEFAAEVWRGRIVSDEVLSRDISVLRAQLGDDAKDSRYILTIPRVGYRLIADVRPLHSGETLLPTAAAPPAADGDAKPPSPPAAEPVCSWKLRPWHWFAAVTFIASIAAAIVLSRPPPVPALDRTHVAVLPFASLSDSPDEFFGDGLTEEIMHALGGIAGISVVAKTSSFVFRDATQDIREIGRKLNAGSLLEGSVRRDADRLRVTVQMIDANSGLQTWSESYDRRVIDIFDVQNQISAAIADRLVGAVSANAPATAPTRDIEAYTLFLRANHLLRQRGAPQLTRSAELFEGVIARDPKFTRAYIGLAEAHTLLPSYRGTSERTGAKLALAAQARADALGAAPADVSAVRGYQHLRARQWLQAKHAFDTALAAAPNDAETLQWYSQFLANVGWLQRSRAAAERAVAADPLSPPANQRAGVVRLWSNETDAAANYFAIAAEVGTGSAGPPEAYIALLLSQGRFALARTMLFDTQRLRQQSNDWIDPALAAISGAGAKRDAVAVLRRDFGAGKLATPMYVGALFFIGDADALFAAMPEVIASGEPFDVELFFSERARALRADRRFATLLTQLHLVEFWNAAGWPDMCTPMNEAPVCR